MSHTAQLFIFPLSLRELNFLEANNEKLMETHSHALSAHLFDFY